MKIYRMIVACATLLGAIAWGSVQAETPPAAPASEANADQPVQFRTRLVRLTESLQLDEGQKAKVSAILKEERAARNAVKADSTSSDDVKKAKRREIADAHNARIRALLTPKQQAAFDEMVKPKARKKS